MKKELKKGESWRKGYMEGYDEAAKAFGGCKNCYGKGYSSVMIDHISAPQMHFCICNRGRQLKRLLA